MPLKFPPVAVATLVSGLFLSACGGGANEVGEFKNDWLGNEIKVEALIDPELPGILCHFTHFDRGVWDRVGKGNWFEDPSNTSIDCLRIGPIDVSELKASKSGEEVFSQRQSLFFKDVAVRRIIDADNRAVLYVSHSRKIVDGSAKMSLSSVRLQPEDTLKSPTP